MRVETDAGAYTGSIELGVGGLRGLVEEPRLYLGLWRARREGSPVVEEYLALHKGAICSVVVEEEERRASGRLQEVEQ